MTLGRSTSNDLLLSDPSVSRTHAAISIDEDGCVQVIDLGSTAGTRVNGRIVTASTAIRSGDVVAFGRLRFKLDGADQPYDATAPLPHQKGSSKINQHAGTQGQYDVESQQAHNISNVAGDQYTSYVQHVKRERESFLKEVAATRTRARWLIWTGATVTIFGLLLFAGSIIQFLNYVFDVLRNPSTMDFSAGIPGNIMNQIAFVGFGMCLVGNILMIVGIILHVIATSRRKRVDRELPVPGL